VSETPGPAHTGPEPNPTPDPPARPWGSALQQVSLRAFDLSERAGRRGLASQRRSLRRWRSHLFLIAQMALAAGLGWFLGQRLLGHEQPFFASIAAILCLGLSYGQRVSRVIEVAAGVFLGVLIGDVFVSTLGSGAWQITLAVFIAMSVALWLGARTLMVMQAGIQAAVVITLLPGVDSGIARWTDALLGCAIALVLALVAPTSPIQRPRHRAAAVLTEAAATLRAAESALRSGDQNAADAVLDRARATETMLSELSTAAAEGVELVRYSPLLRGHRQDMQDVAALVAPLDRLLRNLRVLARRVSVSAYRGEPTSPEVVALVDDVADIAEFCARELTARRLPTRARQRIIAAGDVSSGIDHHVLSLSNVVIVGQARSILVDLLELTGLTYADAQELLPDMH
jgi:uncharacterized membrane protein YgaE (UPF0421/DUF939 family)